MPSTLYVIAHLPAKADKAEELKTLLSGLIAPTRAEHGCIRYELHQNTNDPADLSFIEEWESEEALDNHLQSDHLKSALSQLPDLLASEPQILRYTQIG